MFSKLTPRGFVLPTTLLVTTLLTVMLTAAFILVSAEYRTTDNSLATARALTLAQSGLQNYFAANRNLNRSSTYDSTRYLLAGGYANVVARRLRDSSSAGLALWVVRSAGFSTDPLQPGQVQGRRVVAQLAVFNSGVLPARAAMVAANGVKMLATGANPITGMDANFCPADQDTFGLTVPVGGYSDSATGGWKPPPSGDPSGIEPAFGDASAVIDSTRIDWAQVLGGQYVPDYSVTSPCLHSMQLSSTNFYAGFCNGNAVLTGRRYGLLVVTGNITLGSGVHWDGILVAGGRLLTPTSSSSQYTVHGMVITGLNLSQDSTVGENMIRRGGSRAIQWASCYTGPSINTLSSLVPIRGAWLDTWTTY
jgi:type II secretory pathway pseudopilin PulG